MLSGSAPTKAAHVMLMKLTEDECLYLQCTLYEREQGSAQDNQDKSLFSLFLETQLIKKVFLSHWQQKTAKPKITTNFFSSSKHNLEESQN